MNIAEWLRGLGLGQYEPAFRDNRVDGSMLANLTAEDRKEIAVVPVGDRRKLLEAIAALRAEGAASSPAAAAPAAAGASRSGRMTCCLDATVQRSASRR